MRRSTVFPESQLLKIWKYVKNTLLCASKIYIKQMRSLAAAACVAFVLSVIWFCVSSINLMYFPMHEADDTKRWEFYMVDNYLSVLPMFFLYIVIFKVSLWINRRRCRHEE